MANFLTYEGHYCHHEGMNGCHTLDEYKSKIDGYGDSSSGLVFINLNALFPKSKIVVIHSDKGRAAEFIKDEYGDFDHAIIDRMESRLTDIEGMHIQFDDINSALPDIWQYLIGTEYDEWRGDMLKGLNVQMQDYHACDNAAVANFMQDVEVLKWQQ